MQVAKDAVGRVYDLNGGSRSVVVVAISAYLGAIGAAVEWSGEIPAGRILFRDRADAEEHQEFSPHTKLECRVVTDWKPLTDTEEPLRPAPGSMIEDRPRRTDTEEER